MRRGIGRGEQHGQMRDPGDGVEGEQHALGHGVGGSLDAADGLCELVEKPVHRSDSGRAHQVVRGRKVARYTVWRITPRDSATSAMLIAEPVSAISSDGRRDDALGGFLVTGRRVATPSAPSAVPSGRR